MGTANEVRTRPANRRELIVGAAAALYAERGYENVAMSDVAGAVGVRPSALYRHFANKESLLAEVFAGYVRSLGEQLDVGTPDDPFGPVIDFVLDRRFAGRLWIRESRYLSPATAAPIRESLLARFDALLARPDDGGGVRARSTAVLGVLLSVATHSAASATPPMATLMALLVRRAADGPSAPDAVPQRKAGLQRAAKREQILAAAVDLFADRTYDGVGMDDIAAAVDITSSSIYNHFANKAEILATALHRGNGHLQVSLDDALAGSDTPAEALRGAVSGYASFAVRHPGLVQAIVAEAGELPEPEAMLDAQRAYVDEWVVLLGDLCDDDRAARRTTVLAAIAAMNALARCESVAGRGSAAEEVAASYACRVLGLD